jgi:hypothetical protein
MQQMHQQQRLQALQQQQYMRMAAQQGHVPGGMAGMPVGVGLNMNLLSPAAQQQAVQLANMRARQNPQAQVSRHPGAGVWTIQTGYYFSGYRC